MDQPSFSDSEISFHLHTHKTRMEAVTERLDKIVPWQEILDLIRPCYYVSGRRGRQPYPLDCMLRIYLLQCTYNLSDPQMEDLLHENFTTRKFVGLSLRDKAPDESTILLFRHLLEKHDLGKKIFMKINEMLDAAGLRLVKGRIADASFIEAPTSTKNKEGKRDPDMASGKKGNTWHFGMKMHIATDTVVGVVTDVAYGPANEHDIVRAREVIPPETEEVYGDAGYLGIEKREEFQTGNESPKRQYFINQRPGKLKGLSPDDIARQYERLKSSVRSKVEHSFWRVKVQMGYRKTRYRGIKKNANRINTLLGLSNLFTWECWERRVMG